MVPTAAMAPAQPLLLVLTTEADQERAEELALAIVNSGLAACVALRPLLSLYRWQGALERSQEVQLLIKTHPSRLEALRELVQQRHSYSTPEWIWWQANAGEAYGAWLNDSCGVTGGQGPA